MHLLQNTIMSDNSRLFAKIEDKSLSKTLIRKIQIKKKIRLFLKNSRRYMWADFIYKNQEFSIFSGSGDLMFFAGNHKCSDKILKEVLGLIEY